MTKEELLEVEGVVTALLPNLMSRVLLDTADRHSSWLDDIRNPVPITREVRIVGRQPA